jgi:hypothetical protein
MALQPRFDEAFVSGRRQLLLAVEAAAVVAAAGKSKAKTIPKARCECFYGAVTHTSADRGRHQQIYLCWWRPLDNKNNNCVMMSNESKSGPIFKTTTLLLQ